NGRAAREGRGHVEPSEGVCYGCRRLALREICGHRPGKTRGGFRHLNRGTRGLNGNELKLSPPPANRATAVRPALSGPAEACLDEALAESLCAHAARLPEALELAAHLERARREPGGAGRAARVAVRGLTGTAPRWLAAWLQRTTGRTVLIVTAGGDAFEE